MTKAEKMAFVRSLPNEDAQIDYSDAPAMTPEMLKNAERGRFYRPLKTSVHVRMDADVVDWLKRQGPGHLTRINDIVRDAMLKDLRKRHA